MVRVNGSTDGPRVAIVSQRNLQTYPAFACCVEIEDALRDLLDADLLLLERTGSTPITRLLAPRARVRSAVASLPGCRVYRFEPQPTERYDLAISVTDDLFELSALGAVPGWRELATDFVALAFEEWPGTVESGVPRVRPVLAELTRLYLAAHTVLPTLRRLTGAAASYLPPGMDVLAHRMRLGPDRRIDLTNPGRRDAGQHEVALAWAGAHDAFYWYDSAGLGAIRDLAQHRRSYREMLSRSRVMIANFARCDLPDLRRGAEEVALRQFEAMAAGCLVAGQLPGGPAGEVFADAPGCFRFPLGATELPADLDEVLRSPCELDRLAVAQRVTALRSHDILHRWEAIAADLGYPEVPGAIARRSRLDREAELMVALRPS